MIGQTLDGRYLILQAIGQGGMGAVYEARHTGTNRRVAIKVILRELMAAEHLARFQREARIVGAVESQHITQVFDTGVDPTSGCPYIAMEFLDGEDVGALLRTLGPLPVDLAVRIASQACVGLARAHAAGVIHRDIKSGNVFLHRNEPGHRLVKLLDFGIAKVGGDLSDGAVTKTGAIVGSPLYMSPEQARGQPTDPRSDLFSLGITLYEMLSGRRPNDDTAQLGELILQICTEPAQWLQDRAAWVPAELAGIVHKALAISPKARYQSAEEMGLALRSLVPNGHSIEEGMLLSPGPGAPRPAATRGSPHEHTGNPRAASVAGVSSVRSRPPEAARSGTRMWLTAATLVFGTGGAVAFVGLRTGTKGDLSVESAEPNPVTPMAPGSSSPAAFASAEPLAQERPVVSSSAAPEPSAEPTAEPSATAIAPTGATPQSKLRPAATNPAPAKVTSTVALPPKPRTEDETSRK